MQGSGSRSTIGEDRIREAMEHAASGIAITDLDGHFEDTNLAYRQIVGRTEDQLGAETILSLTYEEDQKSCRLHLAALREQKYPSFVLEKRCVRPDGEAIWVRGSFSLLRDPAGNPSHIVMVCNDIASRRRAERLLIESERLAILGQLASSIAHEINNPLESVLNLLYLAGHAESPEETGSLLARAESEIRRVSAIATNTLQFQKNYQAPSPWDLGELVRSTLILFAARLTTHRIRLDLEADTAARVVCFAGELRQVFANLIRNSIEAMPNGGRLRIRLRRARLEHSAASGVRVTIADTGHGMSTEAQKHLFEAFFTTKGDAGNGLGLWVTNQILVKHRAGIRVRASTSPSRSGFVLSMVFPQMGATDREPGIGVIAGV